MAFPKTIEVLVFLMFWKETILRQNIKTNQNFKQPNQNQNQKEKRG